MTVRKIIGLLMGTFLALSLLSALPAPASAVKPRNDFPRLPRVCATPKEQIPKKYIFCQINKFDRDRPTVLVWGDSHALTMVPAVKRAVGNQDVNVVAFLLGACPPVLSGARTRQEKRARTWCEAAGDLVFKRVKQLQRTKHQPKVILGLNWDFYMYALEQVRQGKPAYDPYVASTAASFRKGTPRLFTALGRAGIDVDVVAPIGQVPSSPRKCKAGRHPYRCSLPRTRVLNDEQGRLKRAQRLTRRLASPARLINVNSEFCNARRCRGRVNGIFTWYDDYHLSATVTRERMAKYFVDSVADVVGSSQPATSDFSDDSGSGPSCSISLLCG